MTWYGNSNHKRKGKKQKEVSESKGGRMSLEKENDREQRDKRVSKIKKEPKTDGGWRYGDRQMRK